MDYYAKSADEVIKLMNSSKGGLSEEEAKKRLAEYGLNELPKEKKLTALIIFISQFKNAFILLLVFACIISLVLGETLEAIAIAVTIALNAVMGFIQEYRAERAMEALEKLSAPTATIFRGGRQAKIPSKELVPGDVLILESGEIVPADSRIFESFSLQIDEAALTGESIPSKKIIAPYPLETSVADQENMAFTGTVVTYGKGRSVVTATGAKTEFGKIASTIKETKEVQTPLQRKFGILAKQIGLIVAVLIVFVFVSGIIQGALSLGRMLIVAVALTVSTIPTSLPVIVTVSLSMGAKRLARKNMLIKKLPAAESLGAATVICTDKTGTITKNEMTVTHIYADGNVVNVSGAGYEPKGNFSLDGSAANPKEYELLLRIGCLCNNAKLIFKDNKFSIIGDPTEGALVALGKKGKLMDDELKKNFAFIEELPFDSERKRMSVIFENNLNSRKEVYVKGAPDMLLEKCTHIIEKGSIRKLTPEDGKRILKINEDFANRALRVLGMAYKEVPAGCAGSYEIKNIEKDLIFVGLAGMMDPPRDEVKNAVAKCREAGIKVIVITGDHALTAKAIAREIGLFSENDIILTGNDIEKMSDDELAAKIEDVRIIARALPIQKSRIVDALKKRGHIVAMTGDGVNDAPAIKKADIGIAMGITGTDVAKEVSKAILIDDNFATIVNAIEEGRNIYNKMIKSARYLLSCNSGEITSMFVAIMLGFPLPMLPLMLLMMNLLTDDFPALGLGFESPEEGIMKQQPRNPAEKPISAAMLASIVVFGAIMAAGTLYIFSQYKDADIVKARTMAFTTLVMFQMFAVMSSKSLMPSLQKLNPFENMWLLGAVCLSLLVQGAVIYWAPLQAVFETVALSLAEWGKIIGISCLGFVMMEISKFVIGSGNGAVH